MQREGVHEALRKIEANLKPADSSGSDPFETVDRALRSHPCRDVAQIYELPLKGHTWAEVAERLIAERLNPDDAVSD
jgi:hypothetical protein